jgi:hypothetical protein
MGTHPQLWTAVRAARRAGEALSSYAPTPDESGERPDATTESDRVAERAILSVIEEAFPEHNIVSEESSPVYTTKPRWIIDPLDGTANFVNGVPHYAVSIAFEGTGTADAGVVYHVPTDTVYTAVEGHGAFADGQPLSLSETAELSNALVVMTSNLGADVFESEMNATTSPSNGFGADRPDGAGSSPGDLPELSDDVLERASEHFSPELWNRIDEKLVFSPLSRDEIADIARLQLEDSAERIRDESGIDMEHGPGVIDHLIENGGYDRELGARPMRQTIQRLVEGKVAREIPRGDAARGDTVRGVRRNGELCCE